jgi:probable HAF family extracellular repeat protein
MRAFVFLTFAAVACGTGSRVHPAGDEGPTSAQTPLPAALRRVTISVEGSGAIRSDPAGVDCTGTCSAEFPAATTVRLTALADPDWEFDAFHGTCAGDSCELTLAADMAVAARFRRRSAFLSVVIAGDGSGRIASTPAGIDCPGRCSAPFLAGTKVGLFSSPAALSRFSGWSGACTGKECQVVVHADTSAVARFDLRRYAVTFIAGPQSLASTISPRSGLVAGAWFSGGEFFWDGVLHDVGMAWPTDLHAINDSGTIVGVHGTSPAFRAFRWDAGVATDLPTLGGGSSWANAINARGVIAGWSELADQRVHATSWVDGFAVDLGVIDRACGLSQAFGINSDAVIVGEACVGGAMHPVRFRKPGVIDDLGSWGGTYARAVAINDAGVIVGYATRPRQWTYHAFVWMDGTALRDVGSLPGLANSYLGCINGAGVAAGISFDEQDVVRRGIVWGEDRLFDLNDLVVPGPYFIDSAACVDESGRIAAMSVFNSEPRAVLLTPL